MQTELCRTLGIEFPIVAFSHCRDVIQRGAHTPGSGANKLINYFVGQVVGSLTTVRPARQVLLNMVEGYVDVVDRLGSAG